MSETSAHDPDSAAPTAGAPEELVTALEQLVADPRQLADLPHELRKRLLTACGRLATPTQGERRMMVRALRRNANRQRREHDQAALLQATLRRSRVENKVERPELPRHALPPASAPTLAEPRAHLARVELTTARACYVCKAPYTRVHFFYDSMCQVCGDLNHRKRGELADLSGRVALVTGGRVKIGQEIVKKLLASGARVLVTTRFAADAARRYAALPEFEAFRGRLEIHGLDLRHTPSVERFCRHVLEKEARLDVLINNACQTVRRPPGFYGHLLEGEARAAVDLGPDLRTVLSSHETLKQALGGAPGLPAGRTHAPGGADLMAWSGGQGGVGITAAAELSQVRYAFDDATRRSDLFPEGRVDADLQQVDLRLQNTWRLALAEVETAEMLEVQLVNAVAPFILCARLKGLMRRGGTGDRHVVNVSAMEGIFARGTKTDKHPHTNMAKAALNMMTLTASRDYVKDGIHMNAVDTGWVTDEDPAVHADRKKNDLDFQPPLDIVDGAARVCDPFFSGLLTGEHVYGRFLKDYKPSSW